MGILALKKDSTSMLENFWMLSCCNFTEKRWLDIFINACVPGPRAINRSAVVKCGDQEQVYLTLKGLRINASEK